MGEAEDGAAVEVELVAPGEGVVRDFVGDERGDVDAYPGGDGGEDGAAGEGEHFGEVLGCGWRNAGRGGIFGELGWVVGVAIDAVCEAFRLRVRGGGRGRVEEVADWHEDDEGVFAFWGGAGVDAGGDVDVEAGLIGDEVFFEDGVEGLFVFVGEEDVVRREFGNFAVQGPVK